MKKYSLLLVVFFAFAVQQLWAQPTFKFTPEQIVVDEGDEVCLALRVVDFTSLIKTSFTISFDPGVVSFQEIKNLNPNVTGLDIGDFDISQTADGLVLFDWSDGQPCTTTVGGVTLPDEAIYFEICFIATGIYGNHTPVTIIDEPTDRIVHRISANCLDIGEHVEDGFISIGTPPLTVNISSGDGFQGDLVCLDFSVEDFDNLVSYQFAIFWDSSILQYENALPMNLQNFTNGNIGQTQTLNGILNVNWLQPTGSVSLPDGTQILQVCFNIIGECGESSPIYIAPNPPSPVEVINFITSQGDDGVNIGLLQTEGEVAVNCFNPNGITLNIEDKEVCPGETFTVDITVENFQDITDLRFNLKWNPSVIQLNNNPNDGITYPDGTPCFNFGNAGNVDPMPGQGIIEVDWSTNFFGCDISDGKILMRLHFTAIGSSGTNSTIAITNPIFVDDFGGPSTNIGINNNNGLINICQLDNPTMIAGSGEANPGETICIPFTTKDFDDILRMQYTISWEPGVLEFESIQNLNLTNLNNFNFLTNQALTQGVLGFEWENGTAVTVPDGTVLFEVCYTVTGDPDECTAISFGDNPWPVDVQTTASSGTNVGLNGQPGAFCTLNPFEFVSAVNDIYGEPGEIVCVDVSVENFQQLTRMKYSLTWNTDIIEYSSVQPTGSLASFGTDDYNDDPALTNTGQINIDWSTTNLQGISVPNGTVIFQLCFLIVGDPDECSGVSFAPLPEPVVNSALTGPSNLGVEGINGSICVNNSFLALVDAQITNVDCPSNPQGAIDITVNGGSGNYAYDWTGPGVNSSSEDQSGLGAGDYFVTVSDLGNPALNLELDFEVGLSAIAPLADAGQDTTFSCSGFSLTLNGSGSSSGANFTYLWSDQPGGLQGIVLDETAMNPVIIGGDCFVLTVTNTNSGCTDRDTVCIATAIKPAPEIAESDLITCTNDTIVLDGGGNNFFFEVEWTTDATGSIVPGTENQLQPMVTEPGWYYLNMSNPNTGCSGTDSVFVEANRVLPDADAGPDAILGCNDTEALLDGGNSSTGAFTYNWTPIGPGEICGPLDVPTTSVCAAGVYELVVTNVDNGCTAIDFVEVTADTLKPVANAGPDRELTCDATEVMLDGSASSTGNDYLYTWLNSTGTPVSNALTFVTDMPGTYILQVLDTTNNCQASSDAIVIDAQVLPEVSAQVDHPITCDSTTATLDGTGSAVGMDYAYQWFDESMTLVSDELVFDASEPGFYTLLVTNVESGCTNSEMIEVLGNNDPIPVDAGLDTTIGCVDFIVLQGELDGNYPDALIQWQGPGLNCITNGTQFEASVSCPGMYKLLVFDPQTGCSGEDSLQVAEDFTTPSANAGDDAEFPCSASDLTLEGSTDHMGASILWTSPGGSPIQNETTLTPTITEPGVYVLTVISPDNNCEGTDEVVIQEPTPPLADAGEDGFVDCLNTSLTLSAVGSTQNGTTFTWTALEGQVDPAQVNDLEIEVEEGIYELLVTDQNGCEAADTVVVINNGQLPDIVVVEEVTKGCQDETVELDATGTDAGLTYLWTDLEGNIIGTGLTAEVSDPGIYFFSAFNAANNCESTAQVTVTEVVNGEGASAAFDHDPCEIEAMLLGNLPAGTSGVWTSPTGSVIEEPALETTLATGLQEGVNLFVWTLTLGTCENYSSDSVVIQVDQSVPVATNDFAVLAAGGDGTVTVNVLDNDNYVPGEILFAVLDNDVLGQVTATEQGAVTFAKEKCFAGVVEIAYEICNINCPEICSQGILEIEVEEDLSENCDEVPNGITPNGDGVNDELVFDVLLNSNEEFPDNEIIIFNRWGDIVYQARPYQNDWRGTNDGGGELPHGTYYYILKLDIGKGDIIRGDVTILK